MAECFMVRPEAPCSGPNGWMCQIAKPPLAGAVKSCLEDWLHVSHLRTQTRRFSSVRHSTGSGHYEVPRYFGG